MTPAPALDVVELCTRLLRIDTSNPGGTEEAAAALVVDLLAGAGCTAEVVEPAAGRCSVVSRLSGRERDLPALVVHGHLDVVPAGEGWTRDPFGGEVADGCLWGRGALDMKGSVAMMLAVQLRLAAGAGPRRDVVFAYFADEEQGGALGARWITRHRPDLFAGAGEAIGEIGGFAITLPGGRRLYPLQTGERATSWARVTVPGRAGHAAAGGGIDCIGRLAGVVRDLAELPLSGPEPKATQRLARVVAGAVSCAPDDREAVAGALGPNAALLVGGAPLLRPSVLAAGNPSSPNVVPGEAHLHLDCRFLRGRRDAVVEALTAVLDEDMRLELDDKLEGVISPVDGPLLTACAAAVRAEDPDALVAPFVLPGASDGAHLARLGIAPYGFMPLVLPPGDPYLQLFHAADERVPVDALRRGERILHHLIAEY